MEPARRRLTAWIASLAILLAALAPSLAQALATVSDRAAPWTEICTATGTQAGSESPPGSGDQSGHGIKHCPWCAGSSYHCALPAADYAPPFDGRARTSAIDIRQQAQSLVRHRGPIQPRAPPTRS